MIKSDSIRKSYLSTLLINIISKPLGLVSSALIAYYFGTGQEIDAFLWVSYFVILFYGLTIGTWESAIVPVLTEIKNKEGIEVEKKFVCFIFSWAVIIIFFAAMILYFGASFFVDNFTSFDESRKILATNILKIMVLYYIFVSLYNISEFILNGYREFKTPYFLKVFISPLIIVVMIYFFASSYGIDSLILANILSYFLILTIVIYFFIKRSVFSAGIVLIFDKVYVEHFLKILLPIYFTQIINNAIEIFSKYLLTGFQVGAVAFVNYAERLVAMINSAFAENLSKIYFTEYGHILHAEGKEALARMYEKNLYLVWMIVIPISSFLFFFGDYILAILFKRGAFDEESLKSTFSTLQMLSLGLFAWSGHLFTGKLFATLKDTIISVYLIVPNSIVIVVMYYYLAREMGFEGVALSSSLSAIYSYTLYLIIFYFRHFKLPLMRISSVLFIILIFWFALSFVIAHYLKYNYLYNLYDNVKYLISLILIYATVFFVIFKLTKSRQWMRL